MQKYETLVRRGLRFLPEPKYGRNSQSLTRGELTVAWLSDYVLAQGEISPALKQIELDPPNNSDLYAAYTRDFDEHERVQRGTFFNLWYEVMQGTITDPHKGDVYEVKFRRRRAVGFKACDECERLKLLVKTAKTKVERDMAVATKIEHFRSVARDRKEAARLRLQCKNNPKKVGFSIDAVDSNKWQTPTTQSRAKVRKNNICMHMHTHILTHPY